MRLFVALELPTPVGDVLHQWCPRDDGLRVVDRGSLHLTLAFLGERSAAEADAAARVVRTAGAACGPVDGLTLRGARWLPARRPRVLAVEVVDGGGGLGALHAAVVAGLGTAIGWVPERRAFLAHVTVARVRRGGRTEALAPLPDVAPFGATALTLMRSHLGGMRPARYSAVETVAL